MLAYQHICYLPSYCCLRVALLWGILAIILPWVSAFRSTSGSSVVDVRCCCSGGVLLGQTTTTLTTPLITTTTTISLTRQLLRKPGARATTGLFDSRRGNQHDNNDNNNNCEVTKENDYDEEEEWWQPKSRLDLRSFQYNNVAAPSSSGSSSGKGGSSGDDWNDSKDSEDYSALQPPVFNLRKESLLFDENATTLRDNNVRRLWDFCVTHLPYVLHGGSTLSDHSNSNNNNNNKTINVDPMAALYNMMFVRVPVIAAAWMYLYQWITRQQNPLIVDLGIVGDGDFAVPPLLVGLVLWIILR